VGRRGEAELCGIAVCGDLTRNDFQRTEPDREVRERAKLIMEERGREWMSKNVSNGLRWRLPGALGVLEPKKGQSGQARGLGSGGKSVENSSPGPPFSATFSHEST
jgi:hypothetical protein